MEKLRPFRNKDNTNRSPRETVSLDSIASVIFPWKRIPTQRPAMVAGSQAGREVDPVGYFLCMCSIMLLSTGIGICGATLWVIMYTIPYIYLTDSMVPLGTNTFSLCGGMISIPCCWIACTSHDIRKNYTFLPLLMVLIGFSLTMLTTSASMGLIYKSRMSFNMTSNAPKLLHGQYRNLLNATLFSSMSTYGTNYNHCLSWDKVQQRFKCCGISMFTDWLKFRKIIPRSCCFDFLCNQVVTYTKGCLDQIAYDLMWQISLISGLSLILLGVQIFTLCLASYMYVQGRLQMGNSSTLTHVQHSITATVMGR